jgi:hypothetical protein
MTETLKVFIGYDHRQPVSYNVLQHSIFSHASKPVSITALVYSQLPLTRDEYWRDGNRYDARKIGLTPFTFTRFLVPYLCSFKGWALFLDIDMLVKDDIAKLFELADSKYTVMVSKNEKRFEWASMMLFNCEKCTILTPDYVDKANGLHQIRWCDESEVGDLPREWNHLVGYDDERKDAKLIHFTQGVPCFQETIECEYSTDWHNQHRLGNASLPWKELMGSSVHAIIKDGVLMPKFKAGVK